MLRKKTIAESKLRFTLNDYYGTNQWIKVPTGWTEMTTFPGIHEKNHLLLTKTKEWLKHRNLSVFLQKKKIWWKCQGQQTDCWEKLGIGAWKSGFYFRLCHRLVCHKYRVKVVKQCPWGNTACCTLLSFFTPASRKAFTMAGATAAILDLLWSWKWNIRPKQAEHRSSLLTLMWEKSEFNRQINFYLV